MQRETEVRESAEGANDRRPRPSGQEHLVNHLRDAHAVELGSARQLARAAELCTDERVRGAYEQHLQETKEHEQTIRRLVEKHDQKPSPVKDKTFRGGAIGLRQLADITPDTPVKLAMHMFALEHLEIATHELLASIARRTEDSDTAEAAERLIEEERNAAERVAESFDQAAATAADEDGQAEEETDVLLEHLREVHGLEMQSLKLLQIATEELTDDEELKRLYSGHLEQTREHEKLIDERIRAREEKPSPVRDLHGSAAGVGFSQLSERPPDTPVKLAMNFYCFEHLEVAAYELLVRIAKRLGDDETVQAAQRIADQERSAAQELEHSFDRAVEEMFESAGSYARE
jgi:ferritin-like metal-binding protein YciE